MPTVTTFVRDFKAAWAARGDAILMASGLVHVKDPDGCWSALLPPEYHWSTLDGWPLINNGWVQPTEIED